MKRLLFLLCIVATTPAMAGLNAGYPDQLTDLFQKLRNRDLDLAHPLPIKDKTLLRGDLTIHFTEGVFYPHQIVNGQVYGGVYYGTGYTSFTFADEASLGLYSKLTKESDLHERAFDTVVLEFDDATFAELFPELVQDAVSGTTDESTEEDGDSASSDDEESTQKHWAGYTKVGMRKGVVVFADESTIVAEKTTEQKEVEKVWKKRASYMRDFLGRGLDMTITRNTVEGGGRPVFAAEMHLIDGFKKGRPWLAYVLDPWEKIEQQLFRHWPFPTNVSQQDAEVFCMQELPEQREEWTLRQRAYQDPSVVDAKHYIMDIELYEDKDEARFGVKASATLRFLALDNVNSVMFNLLSSTKIGETQDILHLGVRQVSTISGRPVYYVHDDGKILIQLPHTLRKGDTYELKFNYGGLIIDSFRQDDIEGTGVGTVMYGLLNTYPWFPQDDDADRYTFDITVRTPETVMSASSGTLVDSHLDKAKKQNVIRSRETVPSLLASVIMGKYRVSEGPSIPGKPKIRVYAFPRYTKDANEFIEEAQGIIEFYESLFGPYPYKELDIAQMGFGFGFGQAPPGLVQLTGEAYLSKTELAGRNSRADVNFRNAFLAHEIGHEWWGHRVGWQGLRDQWISETFAEFSSALYVRDAIGENAWEGKIREWKGWALNNKKTDAGWQGGIMGGKEWQATAYRRGPLIMYCIYEAMGSEFLRALRIWQDWINSRMSSTEDFQLVLESVTGKDWTEFFQTYIYANGSLKELFKAPIRVLNLEGMPPAPERGTRVGAPEEVVEVEEEASVATAEEAAIAFMAWIGDTFEAERGAWKLDRIVNIKDDKGAERAQCVAGNHPQISRPLYLCWSNLVYKDGAKKERAAECQAFLYGDDLTVLDTMPDDNPGGWCAEK